MRIKICGITRLDQARSILDLGISTIGFICVESSPRFIDPSMIGHIIENLAQEKQY